MMSCCGKNRALAAAYATRKGPTRAAEPLATTTSDVMFEYVGRGEATVHGPTTGRAYRFGGNGDRLRVDPRDRPGLAAMALLRQVR
jgi:hypothetical protein